MLGGVAHLVERYIRIVEVVSSSLIVSTSVPLDPIRPWVQRYFLSLRLDRKRLLFCFIFTAECPDAQTRSRGIILFFRLMNVSDFLFGLFCCAVDFALIGCDKAVRSCSDKVEPPLFFKGGKHKRTVFRLKVL